MNSKSLITIIAAIVCCLALAATPAVTATQNQKTTSVKPSKQGGDFECQLCEMVVGVAESYANKSKAEIENELLKVCQKLGPYEQICDELVLMQLPSVIDQILQKETPKVVCSQLDVCKSAKMVQRKGDGEICKVCQLVANQVEQWATSQKTVSKLESELDKLCTSSVPSEYTPICKYAVQEYVPKFMEYAEQKFTPKKCCGFVGLCGSAIAPPPSTKSKPKSKPKQTNEFCSACEAAVNYVKTKMGKPNVQKIRKELDFACKLFQINECAPLVNQAAVIAKYIESHSAKAICSNIVNVCPAGKSTKHSIPFQQFLKEKDEKYCPICLEITKYLEKVVTGSTTTQEIIKLADKGCDELGEWKDLCKKFVPIAVNEMKQKLQEHLPPHKICKGLDMCSSNKEVVESMMKLAKLDLCGICKVAVSYADNYLTQNSTEAEIRQVLDKVCTLIPGEYKPMCLTVIEQYEQHLIRLFINDIFNPSTVCGAIDLCSNNQKKQNFKNMFNSRV